MAVKASKCGPAELRQSSGVARIRCPRKAGCRAAKLTACQAVERLDSACQPAAEPQPGRGKV